MLRQSFTDIIFATNTDGSGKAVSYVRALDMLGPPLTKHCPKPIIGGSMWHSFSLADIHAFSRSGTRPSSRLRRKVLKTLRQQLVDEKVCEVASALSASREAVFGASSEGCVQSYHVDHGFEQSDLQRHDTQWRTERGVRRLS